MGKINIKNTDPAYWEKVLKRYKLGNYQPMTDNSRGKMDEAEPGPHNEMERLRRKVDGSDRFMRGHQITKVMTKEREIPEWALSDKIVQSILLRSFPKLATHSKIKKRAGRWARIIYLYYRMKLPLQVVAKELDITDDALRRILFTIRNRAKECSPPDPLPRDPEREDENEQGASLRTAGEGGAGESRTPSQEVPMPKRDRVLGSGRDGEAGGGVVGRDLP